MFTPIDLTVEGLQSFDLIAGNIHKIGTVYVMIQDGSVTVTYELNSSSMRVDSEFLTILNDLDSLYDIDHSNMTPYRFGKAISISEDLLDDDIVLLYLCNEIRYDGYGPGVEHFSEKNAAYQRLVDELSLMLE